MLGGPSCPTLRDLWTEEDEGDVRAFLEAVTENDLLAALSAIEGTPSSVRLEDEAQIEAWAAVAARRLTVLPSTGPFALSRLLRGLLVDDLGFRMSFDARTGEGTVVANLALVDESDLDRAMPHMVPVFARKLGMGPRIALAHAGETLAGVEIPSGLRSFGVPEDAIPAMASEAAGIERLMRNNPRKLSAADIEKIYRAAY